MKKVSLMIVAIIVVCILSTAIFTACSGIGGGPSGPTGPKQVPIYQGMEISGSMPSFAASAMAAGDHQEDNNKDGHKHGPGCTHGNGEDRDEDLDEDDPFEEDVPTMEEVAESTLQVVGAEKDIYYADQNETIYITIKIENPDSFEILSFTLNGQKYSNYMFEDGSDLEHLILKLNVGNAEGIVDYTIDAIKYVDGTEIKDVRMEGDKTVKAGVRRDNLIVTSVTNEDVTMTSISFDVSITDTTALIEKSGGYAKAVLYDGVNFVSQDIVIGETQAVQFENLTPNTVYQYSVVALYDDLSGVGPDLNVLYKNAVYTDTIVLFKDLVVEQERFQWDYLWHETITDGTITALELFKDGQKIQDLDPTAKEVTGLLTSNAYTIVATYKNLDGADETIYMDFITLAKAMPSATISNLTSTQTQVLFELSITDTDNVGAISKIELLHGNDEPILATDLTARTFENLLSNNDYTVKVTYTYNLNDGVGEQQIVKTANIKTKAKSVPTVEIVNVQSTQTQVSFELSITDTDNVGAISKIELLHGNDEPILATDLTARTFENLLSNNDYTVKVTYTYDLNDGVGELQIVKTADIKTKAKAVPTVEITNAQSTQTQVSFELSITDTDNVGAISKIELLHGNDEPILATDLTARTFENLLSNNDYTIQVTYTYDLNDGVGEQTVVAEYAFTTLAKEAPVVTIGGADTTQTSVGFDIIITDTDAVGEITSIALLHGEDEPILADSIETRAFENLLSNNEYTIVVTYTYDLNDGVGEQQIVKTANIKTKAKAVPTVEIVNVQSAQTQVSFELNITDTDNVGAISKIELLHGDDDPIVSGNAARSFENLLSNNDYTIQVTYVYDLNDGVGEQQIVKTANIMTKAKAMPSATISNLTSTQNTIECDVAYADVDSVGSVVEIALYRLENKIKSVPFATHVSFDGLESGIEYKVVVEYKYDLNDGKGEITANVDAKYSTLIDSIAVDDLILLNNNVVKLGEELNLRVYFANSSEIELTGIYVNGQKATVVGGDRIESAIIKFVPTTSGLCRFAIDRVDYVINGIEVNQTIDSSVEVEYPIYKDLNITYTPITISKYENTGDGVYLSFDNEDGYTIFKVNESDDFVTVDSGRIFTKDISITSIEYGYADYGHTTQSCDFRNDYWSDSIHNVTALKRIYTVEDFFAMTDGYYLLMNDLDLRSAQTKAQIKLTGIFDANGHTIRGLSNVVDTSKYEYFDLFQGGSIYDATFKELYVYVNHTNSADYIYVRPLGDAKLYNCTVKGDVVLSDSVNYGDLNIADDSTTYSLNVTIGTTMSTQKHTASNTIAKNAHIVERDDVFYFDCEVGKAFLSYANRNTADYTVEDGTFFVRSYAFAGSETLRSITMPESVKRVGDYSVFANCIIENAVIPIRLLGQLNDEQRKQLVALSLFGDGVTEIGHSAFAHCSGLMSIAIPDSVTSIGSYAFYECTGLTSVTIGNGVTSIGERAFYNCSGLTSVTIPDSLTSIGDYAFCNCSSLTSITIPDSVTSIGSSAFSGCSGLTSITIPDSVTSIGKSTFFCCSGLISVTIGNGVKIVDEFAFYNCSKLTSIVIPSSVTEIRNAAFEITYNIKDIYITDIAAWCNIAGLNYLMGYGSSNRKLYINNELATSISIPDGVTAIPSSAFSYCTSLTSITIPASVTCIGSSAFSGCSGLTSLTIPDSVTSIGSYAFYDCNGLTSVIIPTSVTSIDGWAFSGCSSLTSITIPDSVTSIGDCAFDACSGLTRITIPDSVTNIGDYAFQSCSKLQSIYITDIAAWCNIAGLNYLMNYSASNKKLYLNNELATSVTIPDGVTAIPDYAFYGCNSLSSITIPDSVTSIGSYAFYNCTSLTSVTIGDSVMSIGEWAFYNCSGLSSVTIGNSVTSIGDYAFCNCSSLTSVTIGGSVTSIGEWAFGYCYNLTSIVIPDSVTTIGNYAFTGCSGLTSVTIGNGVTSIGDYAFDVCSSLTSVYFTGTEEQWNAISTGINNTGLTNATKHFEYVAE